MRFEKHLISEAALTHGADINEILYGFYMAGENWSKYHDSSATKKQLELKKAKVSPEEYIDQDGRAKSMAQETLKWMNQNGYRGTITDVWWTARPGILGKAVGQQVDSRKNPTDVLVKTSEGKFLGLSAKSTKKKGDIGFKNPGIGTIDKTLGTKLKDIEQVELDKLLMVYPEIPKSKAVRKKFIRENPDIKEKTIEAGKVVMELIRDGLLSELSKMSQDELRTHVLENWMDAEELYPPYIKVTGHGKNGKYTSSIMNPLENSKIEHLNMLITLEKVGSTAIGVIGGGKRIMKMRVKYESERLASSIKLSGDPW